MFSQKVDEGVTFSKHSILNKIIVAGMSFGLLAALVTLWRDFSVGILLSNSVMNLGLVVGFWITWVLRNRLTIQVKSTFLFFTFFFIGCKNILLFGPLSAGIIFLGFCCMIVALIFEIRWTITVAILISLIIPLRAFLHFAGINTVEQNFPGLLSSASIWVTTYAYYLLTAFIIAMGVGQLRLELNKNFGLLRQAVRDLELANSKLTQEVELKNAYAEDLLVSTRKFEGLFEGSRDGVLLLNSNVINAFR